MVGLRQVLHIVQRQPGEAPAPVGVAALKGERRQATVLVHAQQWKGALDERGRLGNQPGLVVKTHVKRRLGGEIQGRVAKGDGAETVDLCRWRRTVLPQVDVQPVIGLVRRRCQHRQRADPLARRDGDESVAGVGLLGQCVDRAMGKNRCGC